MCEREHMCVQVYKPQCPLESEENFLELVLAFHLAEGVSVVSPVCTVLSRLIGSHYFPRDFLVCLLFRVKSAVVPGPCGSQGLILVIGL